jgi:hypothetical protein
MRTNHTDISNVFNIAGHLKRSKMLTPLSNNGTIVIYNGLKRIGWHYVQNLVTYLNSVYDHLNVCIPIANVSWDSTEMPATNVGLSVTEYVKRSEKRRRRVFHCETQTVRTNSHVS